jgi:hypothetical protein
MSIGLSGLQWTIGIVEMLAVYAPCEFYVRKRNRAKTKVLLRAEKDTLDAETSMALAREATNQLQDMRAKYQKLQAQQEKYESSIRQLKQTTPTATKQTAVDFSQYRPPRSGASARSTCNGCGYVAVSRSGDSLCVKCQGLAAAKLRYKTGPRWIEYGPPIRAKRDYIEEWGYEGPSPHRG